MSRPVKLLSVSIALICLLLALNFGLRSSMGFFMAPISLEFGYGREVFAFALALQNLCWGLFQPIAGAFADRYGTLKTLFIGAALYALGLYVTSGADGVLGLNMGAGVLMGMGIAATGFGVVLPAMARMVSPEKRSFALGLGSAAGSAGQLLVIPVAQEFIAAYGWSNALVLMAVCALMMVLLSSPFRQEKNSANSNSMPEAAQTMREALNEASAYSHYWLLVVGFFVCGFQLAFITVHMPAFYRIRGFRRISPLRAWRSSGCSIFLVACCQVAGLGSIRRKNC